MAQATFTVPADGTYSSADGRERFLYKQGDVVPIETAVRLQMTGARLPVRASGLDPTQQEDIRRLALSGVPLHDAFTRPATTAGLGSAPSGHVWENDTGGKIFAGEFVPSFAGAGSVYARTNLGRPCVKQSARFRFGSPSGALTMICSHGGGGDLTAGGAFREMAHLVIAPTGSSLTIWNHGAVTSTPVAGLAETMATDGTAYTMAIWYDTARERVVIERPGGTVHAVAVPGLAAVVGEYVVFQILCDDAGDDHTRGFLTVDASCDPPDSASVNLITNPYAAVDLTAITSGSGVTRTRTVGASPGGNTFVRVACDGVSTFQGVTFAGAALPTPDDGPVIAGGVWLRGAVGGEVVDVYHRVTYGDASILNTSIPATLTTDWVFYAPLPKSADAAKTVATTQILVLQDGSAPNPAITYDAAGATVVNAPMVV